MALKINPHASAWALNPRLQVAPVWATLLDAVKGIKRGPNQAPSAPGGKLYSYREKLLPVSMGTTLKQKI